MLQPRSLARCFVGQEALPLVEEVGHPPAQDGRPDEHVEVEEREAEEVQITLGLS